MSEKKLEQVEEKERKSYGKFQWFFFVIFIPTIFLIILSGIVLSIIGINVIDHAKQFGSKVPVVSKLFVEKEEPTIDDLLKQITEKEEKFAQLESELHEREDKIKQLERQLTVKEQEFENEREKIKEVEQQAKEDEAQKELKQIAKTYELMSAKNAANILAELSDEEALLHISEIPVDKRAAILAKMEPERAARLMEKIVDTIERR